MPSNGFIVVVDECHENNNKKHRRGNYIIWLGITDITLNETFRTLCLQ